jgi:hypothetical protein
MIYAKEFLANKRLAYGPHAVGDRTSPDCEMCAREALCFAVTGRALDKTPVGYPAWWSVLPPINDALADDERNALLRPRLWRYAIPEDRERDERIMWRIVTLAITVFAADACERAGLHKHAEKLRAFGPIGPHNAADAEAAANAADAEAADAHHANAAYHGDAATAAYVAHHAAYAAYAANAAYHGDAATAAYAAYAANAAYAAAYVPPASTFYPKRIDYFTMLLDAIDSEIQ